MLYIKSQRTFLYLLFAFLAVATTSVAQEKKEHPFKKDIAAFERDRLENPPPEGAVLCVGSSSMRMWNQRMQSDLRPLTVIPRGFGGSKFKDVLYYFDELVVRYKPRAILIYEGDNDVSDGMAPESILDDFKEFRRRVADLDEGIRIYAIGVKPSLQRWNFKEQIEETNRLIAEECDRDAKLTFIDVSKFLLDDEGEPLSGIFLDDGLHLNTVGYNLWAAAIGLQLIPAESAFEVD